MGLRIQFIAAGILSIICVNIGIMLSWPSSTIELFSTENTTLSRPMTDSEISLFGSLSSIGSLIGTPLSGFLLDKIGRKYLTVFMAAMQVITWIIRVATKNIEMILFSCALSGLAGCGTLVVGVYIAEFTQESIRGALTSAPISTSALGLLISYGIGGTLDYYTVVYISLGLSMVGLVTIPFLKESPTQLMRKGLKEEAAKSISFYRNTDIDSKEVLQEIECITKTLRPEMDENAVEHDTKVKLSKWQFIKKSSASRWEFGICFILSVLSIFQGHSVIQVYAAPLFARAMPTISTTVTTILLAVVSCITALLSGYLSDIAGRRTLLVYSSLAGGLFCVLLGSQLQVTWAPHWLTAVLIYLYNAALAVGTGTALSVLIAELFVPEIKGLATMLIVESKYVANFVILYIFNPLVDAVGLPPVFYIFTAACFIVAIISFLTLPETKGLTIDEIQLRFSKSTKKNNSA